MNSKINLNKTRIESQIPIGRKYMRKIWIAFLMMAPCLFAQGDEHNCRKVSGGIVTNFLNESGTVSGTSFANETLGTATGDLKGGLGVYVLSLQPGPNGTTTEQSETLRLPSTTSI